MARVGRAVAWATAFAWWKEKGKDNSWWPREEARQPSFPTFDAMPVQSMSAKGPGDKRQVPLATGAGPCQGNTEACQQLEASRRQGPANRRKADTCVRAADHLPGQAQEGLHQRARQVHGGCQGPQGGAAGQHRPPRDGPQRPPGGPLPAARSRPTRRRPCRLSRKSKHGTAYSRRRRRTTIWVLRGSWRELWLDTAQSGRQPSKGCCRKSLPGAKSCRRSRRR